MLQHDRPCELDSFPHASHPARPHVSVHGTHTMIQTMPLPDVARMLSNILWRSGPNWPLWHIIQDTVPLFPPKACHILQRNACSVNASIHRLWESRLFELILIFCARHGLFLLVSLTWNLCVRPAGSFFVSTVSTALLPTTIRLFHCDTDFFFQSLLCPHSLSLTFPLTLPSSILSPQLWRLPADSWLASLPDATQA